MGKYYIISIPDEIDLTIGTELGCSFEITPVKEALRMPDETMELVMYPKKVVHYLHGDFAYENFLGDFDKFQEITNEMHDLYVKKNKDYGDSVTDTYNNFGMVSFLVRMQDKLNRLKSLCKNDEIEVKDESIRDTLIDLANYSILAILEYEKDK